MYRAVLLAFLCTAVSSHWCAGDKPCPWKHRHHHFHHDHGHWRHFGNHFEHLANQVIDSEEGYNNHCNAVSNNVQEMYTNDAYVLIYSPGFVSTEITLQVKHRMINAIINGNGEEFNDIRILPDILNAAQAGWCYDGQNVKVVIPYRINFNVVTPATCININKETITIQKNPNLEDMDVYRQNNGGRLGGNFNPSIQNVNNN
ncbi:unnamed protein product [Pieris macdunnoughi]|uniref:Uncharacterized protein n=1 Tax=Pieris macdunnoughi TaxID=345717 RepID=A0A821SQJ4_9NEOP|nr:unnamed protein product [Pieris macdunnoughi]